MAISHKIHEADVTKAGALSRMGYRRRLGRRLDDGKAVLINQLSGLGMGLGVKGSLPLSDRSLYFSEAVLEKKRVGDRMGEWLFYQATYARHSGISSYQVYYDQYYHQYYH